MIGDFCSSIFLDGVLRVGGCYVLFYFEERSSVATSVKTEGVP